MSGFRHDEGASLPEVAYPLKGLGNNRFQIAEAMPCGVVAVKNGWLIVGTVILRNGRVVIVPCLGISVEQRRKLRAAGDQVWIQGLAALYGWQFSSKLGWVVDVGMRYPSDTMSSRASSSAMRLPPARMPERYSGSSVPSGR